MLTGYWIIPQFAKDQYIISLLRQQGAVDRLNEGTYKAASKCYLVKDGTPIQVGICLNIKEQLSVCLSFSPTNDFSLKQI